MFRKFSMIFIVLVILSSGCIFAAESFVPVESITTNGSDDTVYGSGVLTFDELVTIIAQDKNISILEAKLLCVDAEDERDKFYSLDIAAINNKLAALERATYRTFSKRISVTTAYKPTIKFYCQTSEESLSGSYHYSIKKIVDIDLMRRYNGTTKQFSGKVYANLETPTTIYWLINGDFYDNGTTTYSGGVNIGLGEGSGIGFSVSHATNHYRYCYDNGKLRVGQ